MSLGKRHTRHFETLLARARCPPASEGFGIYSSWKSSPIRPPLDTAYGGISLQRSASVPIETMISTLGSSKPPGADVEMTPPSQWQSILAYHGEERPHSNDCKRIPVCTICKTARFIEQNNDGTLTCGECGCVVEATQFVARTHDKQVRSDEDATTRADDVQEEEVQDGNRAETSSEARSRHIRQAGGTPLSYRKGHSKGFGHAIGIVNRDVVKQHRQSIQWNALLEGRIGQAFKQTQKILDDVEGLDEHVSRECRASLRRVLERDERHAITCKSPSCEVCVAGAGLQLVAGCVVTVVAEHLIQHIDKPTWPLSGVRVSRATLLRLSAAPWKPLRSSTVAVATTKLSVERLLYGPEPPSHCQPLTAFPTEKCLSEHSLSEMDNDHFSSVRNSMWAVVRMTSPPTHLREAMFRSLGLDTVSQWASNAETTPDVAALALALAVARKTQISIHEQLFTAKLRQVALQQMASISVATELCDTVFTLLPDNLGLESPVPASEEDDLI